MVIRIMTVAMVMDDDGGDDDDHHDVLPPQIRAYGACIASNMQSIERGVCEAEFKGLQRCFQKTVRTVDWPIPLFCG